MSNWKKMLINEMKDRGEILDDIIENTLDEAGMEREFDASYGSINGEAFTVWTKNTVYFPLSYDGAEWVGSVSRNPDGKPTQHQGY